MNGGPLEATKTTLRKRAYAAREAQQDKDSLSVQAITRLTRLPEYRRARVVMWYLDCRSELRTRHAISAALAGSKTIVVPYCTVDDRGANKLGLWRLESLSEMVSGKWQILEPPKKRWDEPDRTIAPRTLDFIIVPGVAFDRRGARLGNGQGYYDRLLAQVRRDVVLAGVCFESQLFEEVPLDPHDVRVHEVVTERAVYIAGMG